MKITRGLLSILTMLLPIQDQNMYARPRILLHIYPKKFFHGP